jgi:WD40 repeat protein
LEVGLAVSRRADRQTNPDSRAHRLFWGTTTREGTMSRSTRLLALCFLLFTFVVPSASAQPPAPARTDALGDPLPPHAVARLGTHRLRHTDFVTSLTFSPDGKQLVSCDRQTVCCWDPATGKLLRTLSAPHLNNVQVVCFSADGNWLAVGGWQWLTVFDAATGRLHAKHHDEQFQAHALHFTPDGNTLVAASLVKLIVWDVAAGKHRHAPLDLKGALLTAAVAEDGETVWTLCNHNILSRWPLADGKLVERQTPPGKQRVYDAAFSPDGKWLAAWPDGGRLAVRDPATGKVLPGFAQPKSDPRHVSFSADGKLLVTVAGKRWFLWRVATGELLHECPFEHGEKVLLALAPDGKRLAHADGKQLRLFDAVSGKEHIKPFANAPLGAPVLAVFFAGDNTAASVVGSSDYATTRGLLWDTRTGQPTGGWPGATRHYTYFPLPVLRPQGDVFAGVVANGDVGRRARFVTLFDLRTGKLGRQFFRTAAEQQSSVSALAFSAGGDRLAAVFIEERELFVEGDLAQQVCVWETSTGKLIKAVNLTVPSLVTAAAFAPDGATLVLGFGNMPSSNAHGLLWLNVTTGKTHVLSKDGGVHPRHLVFSPDGRLLAVGGWLAPSNRIPAIQLYEVATGGRICDWKGWGDLSGVPCAFGRTGRVVFVPDGNRVDLRDAFTGEKRGELTGHVGDVKCLALSPDGRTLLTGSMDETALAWDVTRFPVSPAPKPLTAAELTRHWADLLGQDAALAHRAMAALAAAPDQTPDWVKHHVRPMPPLELALIARHVAALDDDRFAVREQAQVALRKYGELVAPILEAELQKPLSLEKKRRVEQLLTQITPSHPADEHSTELLRALRAVAVLECLGTPAARAVLQGLAAGAPQARLTRAAQAAVQRMQIGDASQKR